MEQKPSVGRIVHYVSHGTPVREDGTQAFASQCRAAAITEVIPGEVDNWDGNSPFTVGLCVLNPTGFFFHSIADGGSRYDESKHGGTWHWPERV